MQSSNITYFEKRKKIGVHFAVNYYAVLTAAELDQNTVLLSADVMSLHTNQPASGKIMENVVVNKRKVETVIDGVSVSDTLLSLLPNSATVGALFSRMGNTESAGGYVNVDADQQIASLSLGFRKTLHPDGFGSWDYHMGSGLGFDLNRISVLSSLKRDNFYDDTSLDDRLEGRLDFSYKGHLNEVRSFYDFVLTAFTPAAVVSLTASFGLSLTHYANNIGTEKYTLSPVVGTKIDWSVYVSRRVYGYVNYALWDFKPKIYQPNPENSRTDDPGSIYFNVRKSYSASVGIGYILP